MKMVIPDELRDVELARWKGCFAQLWMFHVSHKKFALRLSRKGVSEELYVVANACVRISGPFSWHNAEIRIEERKDARGQARRRIVDEGARFELECVDVGLALAPTHEFDTTFDHFLGDEPAGSDDGS